MLKKGLVAGLAILILGMVLNWLIGMVFPALAGQYQNTAMFRPWSDPLMTVYFAYPFILGVVSAHLWGRVGKPKPMEFAKLYFVIETIPGMFITYTSFQISLSMVLLWTVTGYIQALVAGYIFAKMK